MEKQGAFHGWTKVFRFTAVQSLKTTKIKMVTIILGIVLLLASLILNVVLSLAQGPSPVQNVYIMNSSDLEGDFSELLQTNKFSHVQTHFPAGSQQELIDSLNGAPYDVAVLLTLENSSYRLKAILPRGTKLTRQHGKELLDEMENCVEKYKLQKAQVDPQVFELASVEGTSQVIAAGKAAKGEGELLMQTLLPMLVSLLLYAMILLYGQTIAKTVVAEKTSKLMETLLTYIRPYALITGKIAAMAVLALSQIAIWILCVLVGLWIGDLFGHILNPSYTNGMMVALQHLKTSGGLSALSVSGVLLSLLALCLGFFLYCVIAGFLNSFASKPEDLSNTMGVFQALTIVSWLIAYFLPLYTVLRGGSVSGVLSYIPFTAAFCLPADILVGNVSMTGALVALSLMAAVTLFFIFLTGRTYRNKVFYRGASPFGILRKDH